MEEGIYIKCLRKGYESPVSGISFNEMIQYLISEGYHQAETHDFKCHFYVWFFDNFFQHAIYYDRMVQRDPPSWPWAYQPNKPNGDTNRQLDVPSPMMLHAQQKYLDYLYLESNNKKAERANWLAWVAIHIAIGIGIAQLIPPLVQLYNDRSAGQYKNIEQQGTLSQSEESLSIFYLFDQDSSSCVCPEDSVGDK